VGKCYLIVSVNSSFSQLGIKLQCCYDWIYQIREGVFYHRVPAGKSCTFDTVTVNGNVVVKASLSDFGSIASNIVNGNLKGKGPWTIILAVISVTINVDIKGKAFSRLSVTAVGGNIKEKDNGDLEQSPHCRW